MSKTLLPAAGHDNASNARLIFLMTTTNITLLVPDLFKGIARDSNQLPRFEALETLLARSDRIKTTTDSFYACVLQQFHIDAELNCFPSAAVSRYAESGCKDERVWMHVDPVFMQADKDRLILRGSHMLELDKSTADLLLQELNKLYAEDDYLFECYHPHQWYLRLPHAPLSRFQALSNVLGRSVEPFMPEGEDQTHWRRFMNEVQMLLHAADVNQQRLEQQQYPVNSIWCWGAGEIPGSLQSPWDEVYTDDVLVKGLSLLSDTQVHQLPESATELLQHWPSNRNSNKSQVLVVHTQNEADLLNLDMNYTIEKLQRMEQYWFKPLLQALKNKDISSISLLACDGMQYRLDKKQLRRFWRPRKRISLDQTVT